MGAGDKGCSKSANQRQIDLPFSRILGKSRREKVSIVE
jgi:hypothetical protein